MNAVCLTLEAGNSHWEQASRTRTDFQSRALESDKLLIRADGSSYPNLSPREPKKQCVSLSYRLGQ